MNYFTIPIIFLTYWLFGVGPQWSFIESCYAALLSSLLVFTFLRFLEKPSHYIATGMYAALICIAFSSAVNYSFISSSNALFFISLSFLGASLHLITATLDTFLPPLSKESSQYIALSSFTFIMGFGLLNYMGLLSKLYYVSIFCVFFLGIALFRNQLPFWYSKK